MTTSPESYWLQALDTPDFPILNENKHVDVVIVGGGITGITTAYLLASQGMKVALLEAGKLLNGTTGHTTAKITAQHDVIYDEFIQHFGKEHAKLYYEAQLNAMHFMEDTIHAHHIDCDYSRQDAFLYTDTEQGRQKLENEYKAYLDLNIEGELVDHIPLQIPMLKALSMKNQAQFHPIKYLAHLVQIIKDSGGLIFEHTVAVNVEEDQETSTVLTRNGHRVTGNFIVSCTHFPFYEGLGLYSTRMIAERSYVIAAKAKTQPPSGMYLSVDKPNRSIRSAKWKDETYLIIGGESHKAGQSKDTQKHYEALEAFGRDTFQLDQISFRWSTQDLITLDKLPYVGEITSAQPHVLIATGFRKWGMTNSTAAAQLISDIIHNNENPFQEIVTPSRFHADPSIKAFLKENIDTAKHLLKGKFEKPENAIKDLSPDEGAVITLGGKRKGAYRDKDGKLHVVDTTCTHAGCEVNWNNGDRTWDCPCHGSRFTYTGDVLEGPAEKPLQRDDHTMLDNLTSENSGY